MLRKVLLLTSLAFQLLTTEVHAADRLRGFMLGAGIRPEEIAELKDWKVNLVRYPLFNHEGDIDNEAQYFEWLSEELLTLDRVMEVSAQNGIKVLLDLHTPPGGYVNRGTKPQFRLFSEKWAQEATFKVWQEVVSRYKGHPALYGYELLNEPAQASVAKGLKNWDKLSRELVGEIRKLDKSGTIVVNPVYGDTVRIKAMKPIRGRGIVYSVHMYYPQTFTHQGIIAPLGADYPTKKLNKKALQRHLKNLVDFQKKNRAKILIHEFGVVRWAPNDSGARYLKDLIDIFEANKWDWTYHAFRGGDIIWSAEHSGNPDDHTRSATPTSRELLLRGYFSRNK